MKKSLFLLVLISMLLGACEDGLDYDRGRDSKAAFGNGLYQIMHAYDGDEAIESLHNCKHNQEVMTKIDDYVKKNNYVYFVGYYYKQRVFCCLNVKTNLLTYYAEENDDEFFMAGIEKLIEDKQIKLSSSFDEFSEEDKAEFRHLMNN